MGLLGSSRLQITLDLRRQIHRPHPMAAPGALLPTALQGFVLDLGEVYVGDMMSPHRLRDGCWAHRGSLVATGQAVLVKVCY